MTDQTQDESVDEALSLSGTSLDRTDRATTDGADVQPYEVIRDAQLEALRTDLVRLRAELAAIAAASSRLVVLEANATVQAIENKIGRHIVPAIVVAGVVGYLWTAFVRPR
ncbi:hypothetical protein AB4Z34_15790 [Ensifer sp. 2YAB10]|uniref:hypothetical protein n=1 Tax=unclassified Ensifer TaxID=2633371 RepID=UPI003F9312B5